MPIQFRLTITSHPSGQERVAPGHIPDADWVKLLAFRAEWERLKQTEWIANGMPARYELSVENGAPMVLDTPGKPTNAQVREVLHGLRPFILQNEPHFVPRTLGIFARALPDEWARIEIKKIGERFSGATQASMIQITANQLQLNSEHALNLWLNAFEFHRDPEKYAAFVNACGGEPSDLDLAIFRTMLADKAQAIHNIANLTTMIESAPRETPTAGES